jgi:hypothetical protein
VRQNIPAFAGHETVSELPRFTNGGRICRFHRNLEFVRPIRNLKQVLKKMSLGSFLDRINVLYPHSFFSLIVFGGPDGSPSKDWL